MSRRKQKAKAMRTIEVERYAMVEVPDGWNIKAAAADFEPIIGTSAEVVFAAAGDGEPTDGPKKFSVQVYNGGALQVNRWDYPVVIDLSGMKARKNVIANLDHDREKRVGHVTDVSNDGSKVVLEGLASASTSYRDEVVESAKAGFPWEASIESMPIQESDFIGEKQKVTVNGREFTGPLYVARKSELYGFAFLSRGADSNTKVKIAAEAASSTPKEKSMNAALKKWIEAQGFDVESLSDAQVKTFERLYAVEAAAANEPPKKPEEPAKAPSAPTDIKAGNDGAGIMGDEAKWSTADVLAAHSDLTDEIDSIIAQHEDDISEKAKLTAIRAKAKERAVGIKRKAITEKWNSDRYELEAVKATSEIKLDLVRAERPAGPAIHASVKDTSPLVIEAALAQTVGLPNLDKSYDDKTLQAAHTQFRGRLGLKQLLIMAAAQNGMSCGPGFAVHAGNAREVLRYAVIEGGHSTLSLPGILSNIANKEILEGYQEEDQSWREVSMIKNVSDFKSVTSYRLLDNMEYDELAPDGRIKHGTLSEESYSRQAKTYAKMFGLTRTDIINDDLGVFDDLRARIGMGAAKKFNRVFWTKFLANDAFYTSGRTNYISGATSNLGTDGVGLSLGVEAFRKMRSPAADGSKKLGTTVGGRPEILVVPPELETAADILNKNTNLGAVANSAANIHANKYRPVVVPWLSDSEFTGYSTTAWYLFRAPRMMAPMVVSFLNGVETPTVESAEADFDQLGIQFRGYHDFGCDQAEYLSGIKSKGAA